MSYLVAMPRKPLRLRKATRNRGHLPSEQAALKVLYLAVREQINPKARDATHVPAH
ncbi:hypothetical protein ABT272_44320 [Streptomyces sp900105245]|uniref:Transposase n=1 Tax=Streptomyces sp. 900105245 TaxID=3154379 RepID=A0ABV1UMX2_9ACTN